MTTDPNQDATEFNEWARQNNFSEGRVEKLIATFHNMSASHLRRLADELDACPSPPDRRPLPAVLQENLEIMQQRVWDALTLIAARTFLEIQDTLASPSALRHHAECIEERNRRREEVIAWRSVMTADQATPTELKDVTPTGVER